LVNQKKVLLKNNTLDLEQRVRFELTVLGICSPLHWASLPPLHRNTYSTLVRFLITRSASPYATASAALIKLSRSMSAASSSNVLPAEL
jgi:hypothetical protein